MRLVPGLDRPLRQALVLVGHHEVEVDLDQVAEAVAGRAGAEGVVEGEEARLRLHEGPAAARALEALGDAQRLPARATPRARGRAPPRSAVSSDSTSAAALRLAHARAGRPAPSAPAGTAGARERPRSRPPSSPTSRRVVAALAQSRERSGRAAAVERLRRPNADEDPRCPRGSREQPLRRRSPPSRAAPPRRTPSQTVRPARAKSSRRWSWISVAVATVERGLRESVRWRMAIAGQMPSTSSTRGFSIRSRNCRA